SIKRLFGVLLIGVALWTVSPVIPAWAQMLAWAALLIISAGYLRVFDALPDQASGWARMWKSIGVVLVLLGAVQIVGAASGGRGGGGMYCGRWNDWLRVLAPRRSSRRPGGASRASTSSMPCSQARAASLYCSTSMRIGASLARRWTASPSVIRASPPSWPACS